MTNHFSIRAGVLVGLLAVTLPVISRLAASPLLLLVLSPLIILTFALGFLSLTIFIGHYLDSRRQLIRGSVHQAARPFAFSTPAAWQAVLTRSQWSQNTTQSLPPLYPQSPEISAALNDVLNKVVRDFVWSWYNDISSSPSFPTAVSSLLHASLAELLRRASSIDLAALIVRSILPKITTHIDQFRQSEMALRGTGLERKLTQSEELDLLLASRYAGKGAARLHPAIDNLSTTFTKQNEEMHLRQLMDRVLPFLLPETEAQSKALRIMAREIAACTVLYPVMEMIADSDFWNRMIDQVVCIQSDRIHHLFKTHFAFCIGRRCNPSTVSISLIRQLARSDVSRQEADYQSSKHPGSTISKIPHSTPLGPPGSTLNLRKHHNPNGYSQI
jgi:sorting nexin-25